MKKIDKYLHYEDIYKGGDLEDSDTYVCMIIAGFLVLRIKDGEVVVKTYLGDKFRKDCLNSVELRTCALIFEYLYASLLEGYREDTADLVSSLPAEVLNETAAAFGSLLYGIKVGCRQRIWGRSRYWM